MQIQKKQKKNSGGFFKYDTESGEIDVSMLDENNSYLKNLRGEGRMINATLENLVKQMNGNNDYLAPLNENFVFYNMLNSGDFGKDYSYFGGVNDPNVAAGKVQPQTPPPPPQQQQQQPTQQMQPAQQQMQPMVQPVMQQQPMAQPQQQRPQNAFSMVNRAGQFIRVPRGRNGVGGQRGGGSNPGTNTIIKYNKYQNIINFPEENAKLSEDYYKYGNVLVEELRKMGLPNNAIPIESEYNWDIKSLEEELRKAAETTPPESHTGNAGYKKYVKLKKRWIPQDKKLEDKIKNICNGKMDDINYYVLLAINLNDRSSKSELKPAKSNANMAGGALKKQPKVAGDIFDDIVVDGSYPSIKKLNEDKIIFSQSSVMATLNFIRNLSMPIAPINDDDTSDHFALLNNQNKNNLFCMTNNTENQSRSI